MSENSVVSIQDRFVEAANQIKQSHNTKVAQLIDETRGTIAYYDSEIVRFKAGRQSAMEIIDQEYTKELDRCRGLMDKLNTQLAQLHAQVETAKEVADRRRSDQAQNYDKELASLDILVSAERAKLSHLLER